MTTDDPPELWQKPSFDTILAYLGGLHQEPPLWSAPPTPPIESAGDGEESAWHRRQAISWLSSIVRSKLGWLEDDGQREQIWAEASRRLAERCGRTGRLYCLVLWGPDKEKQGRTANKRGGTNSPPPHQLWAK
jgi:hypothetical protein